MSWNWKQWPYWLRGGVIGGGVSLAFVVLWYFCALSANTNTPSEVASGFVCLSIFTFSPIFPIAFLLNMVGQSLVNDSASVITYIFLISPIASVIVWFMVGSLIGAAVGHIKKKKVPK